MNDSSDINLGGKKNFSNNVEKEAIHKRTHIQQLHGHKFAIVRKTKEVLLRYMFAG